jgi:MscS family membrane protein
MKRLWPIFLTIALVARVAAAPPEWAQAVTTRLPGSFLGLLAWQWLLIGSLLVSGLVLHWIVRLVARRMVRHREATTGAKTEIGERSIRRGAGILGFVLPWYIAVDAIGSAEVAARIHVFVEALTILGVVMLAYGIWDAVCDAVGHRAGGVVNAEKLLIPVTRKLVRFLILSAGLILALGVFGVNITGLLAGVGIGGLVVALAAKDSVENVFGSLTILFDMPFALGDWVKIDKFEGIVEEINLRSTRIRTFEDSIITLPNSNLIKAAVENYGARRYRRQRFHVRLSYANQAENLEEFLRAVGEYLDQVPEVVKGRTIVEVNEMTEGSVGVLIQCFFEAATFHDETRLRSNLMVAIFRAQEATGVIFVGTPIPQRPAPPISEETQKQIIDKEDII